MTTPTPPVHERDVFAHRIGTVFRRLAENVEAIPPGHVDTRVLADGNTPAVLVAHVLGSARGSILGIGAGVDVDRDRAEEFRAEGGTPEALGARIRAFVDEAEGALAATPDGYFDEVVTPPQAWLGLIPQQPMARRTAVLAAIAHASEHLGELMFIKDTLAARE